DTTRSAFASISGPADGSHHSAILKSLDRRLLRTLIQLPIAMPFSPKSAASGSTVFESVSFQDPAGARANLEHLSTELSPALAGALPSLLTEAPDPDSALLLLDRMATESPETVRAMEAHPFLEHYSIAVFGNSRYLGETLVKNPDLLHVFLREK